MANSGRIHVYYGNGKGKTTAAVGLMVRAAGHGQRVMLVQFLKSGLSGEIEVLKQKLGVKVLAESKTEKFVFDMNSEEIEQTRKFQTKLFAAAAEAVNKNELDLIVLDEVLWAIEMGLLDEDAVIALLKDKPSPVEIVLTGCQPGEKLLELADYISEIRCCRHPFQRGIAARAGIEY